MTTVHAGRSTAAPHRFNALFASSNRMLTQFLHRLTRNPAVAEDVAQQAWTKLLELAARGGSLPATEEEFRAVLYTTARNLFIDLYRRGHFESRTLRLEGPELERLVDRRMAEPGPDEIIDRARAEQIVREALEALPGMQREAVLLWQQGECIQQMARRANVPRDTVLSRKKYAFAKLRARLSNLDLAATFA